MAERQDDSVDTSESKKPLTRQAPSQTLPENSERLERVEELLTTETEDLEFPTAIVRVFGINCPLMEVYLTLLDNPQSTSNELADILDVERNGLNTYLRELNEKGLIWRERAVDGKPGSAYAYTARPLDETTEWMEAELEAWTEDVREELTQLREQYQENSEQADST